MQLAWIMGKQQTWQLLQDVLERHDWAARFVIPEERVVLTVDISAMTHLLALIEMRYQRQSFSAGLTVPFSRSAFFGPPYATPEEIEAEIASNAGQFAVISKSPS